MRESRTEVLTGAAVLVVAAGFLVYMLQASGLGAGGGSAISVLASFRSAEGVASGTDVRMSGVSIGSVQLVALNTATFRADTWMALDAAVPVPDDSTAVVASEGLLGGTYVEIFPGASPGNLIDGAEIVDTQGAISLLQLLLQFVAGGGDQTPAPAP